MPHTAAIILAAGKGTRMKSNLPKVLHEIAGHPLAHYPLELAQKLKCDPIVLVVGHGEKLIRGKLGNRKIKFARQTQQLGSAHAVLAARKALSHFKGEVLILSGDVPLIREETLRRFLTFHRSSGATLTLATVILKDPRGYGRVIRGGDGNIVRIVEETDLTEVERDLKEVNGGLYVGQAPLLFEALKKVEKNPYKKEYYFTDLPPILQAMNQKVAAFPVEDSKELLGVNTRVELAVAERLMQERIQNDLMLSGVTIQAPHRTTVHRGVKVGMDTVIHPDVALLGKTQVGERCVIEQGAILKDALTKEGVTIKAYSYLEECVVEKGAALGPFARIRPGTRMGRGARVGNFVELKNTKLGERSKANHLSYLGDATIGKDVNIGAGTITCNYDGVEKFKTILADGVFVGSDTQLVAPVKVGKGAYIGAGTTVTKNVPAMALAISRTDQKNIVGYSKKKKK